MDKVVPAQGTLFTTNQQDQREVESWGGGGVHVEEPKSTRNLEMMSVMDISCVHNGGAQKTGQRAH